jgi:hypothetical protein
VASSPWLGRYAGADDGCRQLSVSVGRALPGADHFVECLDRQVTGAASLAGTVAVLFFSESFTRSYSVLSAAGGFNGSAFSALATTNLPAGFAPALSYTTTDVVVNLTAVLGQGAGLSQNQQNAAGALNNFFNNGGTLSGGFVSIFRLTGSNLCKVLSQVSGEAATGAQQVGFQIQFLNLMLDPFVDGRTGLPARAAPRLASRQSTTRRCQTMSPSPTPRCSRSHPPRRRPSTNAGARGAAPMAAATAPQAIRPSWAAMISPPPPQALPAVSTIVSRPTASSASRSPAAAWSLAQGLGTGKSDAFQAGVYGATRSGPAYLAAAFAFVNHWMSSDRFAFTGDHLTASFNAQSYGGRVESGYRFTTIYGSVTPYAAIQVQSFRTPGYSETDTNGGGFALSYNSRTGNLRDGNL